MAVELPLGYLVVENDRLEELKVGLETIVAFLNETTTQFGELLEQVTEFLAEQITMSRLDIGK
jgi:hypothetical protein